jgi:uncharacterized protein
MSKMPPVPAAGQDRLEHLDVIRGVALFGILLINITVFGLPKAYNDPTIWGGATGANLWSWIVVSLFFEGTQRGLFSILFGASTILLAASLTARTRHDAADLFLRRSLWLMVFGLLHAYFVLWTQEILFCYGLTALCVYTFRTLNPRPLLVIAAGGVLLGTLLNVYDARAAIDAHARASAAGTARVSGVALTDAQKEDIKAWQAIESDIKPDRATIDKDLAAYRGSYADIFAYQLPINVYYQTWFNYRFFFDVFAPMLIGMALLKTGVLTLERPNAVYAGMAVAGYGIGLAVNAFELKTIMGGQFSALSQIRTWPTYDIGRVATTIGHLGALLLLCRAGALPSLRRRLAAVGQMALTNYVMVSIVCAAIFYGFGLGLYGRLERHQLYYVVAGIAAFQLIASPLWLARYRFGPLEWLWRSLTYWERQPMARTSVARVRSVALEPR